MKPQKQKSKAECHSEEEHPAFNSTKHQQLTGCCPHDFAFWFTHCSKMPPEWIAALPVAAARIGDGNGCRLRRVLLDNEGETTLVIRFHGSAVDSDRGARHHLARYGNAPVGLFVDQTLRDDRCLIAA